MRDDSDSIYADVVDELQDLGADVDETAGAHLRLAAGGLDATNDVEQTSWSILFDDVEFHLDRAARLLEDPERLYQVRAIHSLVRAGRNLGRTRVRREP